MLSDMWLIACSLVGTILAWLLGFWVGRCTRQQEVTLWHQSTLSLSRRLERAREGVIACGLASAGGGLRNWVDCERGKEHQLLTPF
jgi:hypothetical protein